MLEELRYLEGTDFEKESALDFEDFILTFLEKKGFVKRQVKVENRGDGRKGKIDFVVYTDSGTIAIEVDRKTPRKKSRFKLENFPARYKYLMTRNPFKIIELPCS